MADSRRIRLIILITLGVIVVALVVGWFVVVPGIVSREVDKALSKAQEKTGRTFETENVRLAGLTGIRIGHLTVSDVNEPSKIGISVDDVCIHLSGLPINDDFSISSVRVGDLNVSLRRSEDGTNFDDIIRMLKPKPVVDEVVPAAAPKPETWKRYFTPFPDIEISSVAITTDPIHVTEDFEVGAVSANDVHVSTETTDAVYYLVDGSISALLVESGTPTTYRSSLSGRIRSGKNGEITLSAPKSEEGSLPAMLTQGDTNVTFDNVIFRLPTTFELTNLKVAENDRTLVQAASARARLMTLPPTKVSGVYLKEVELVSPEIHDILTDEGSTLINLGTDIGNRFKKKVPEAEKAAENVIVAPKKHKSPKDHFFSQRMFVTDGKVVVEDLRKMPATGWDVSHINLEIGYRSIRKVLDYQISLNTTLPVEANIALDGQYQMKSDETQGKLEIHDVRNTEALRKFWAREHAQMVENQKDTNALKILDIFASTLGGDDYAGFSFLLALATISATMDKLDFESSNLDVGFYYNLKTDDLTLNGSADVDKLQFSSAAVSRDPVELSGKTTFDIAANLKNNIYNFKSLVFESGDIRLENALKLEKVYRKTRERSAGHVPQMTESWQFDLHSVLPDQKMQQIFEAVPHALRNELDGLEWAGTLGFDFSASGYLNSLSEVQHKFNLTLSSDFAVTHWPVNKSIQALNTGMLLHVNDPNALNAHTITIPPSIYGIWRGDYPVYTPRMGADDIRARYPAWAVFEDLNPWLIQLITTTEDGSFFTHEGFSPMQIKAALERNVDRGSFSRGASTISMQLIKNLFFDRTKSIARKSQEVLYTWLMESVIRIPKQRIMELYFNIIEFGPEIYGIEEAAKYYFGKRSIDLSLKECAFLMAIIPKPRSGANHRQKPTLDKWLQSSMNFYIQEMYRRKCNPETLANMRSRYARRNQKMPYEPCCPPKDSLQLMLDADTMAFYIPNPSNPSEYAYDPSLYTPGGTLLTPRRRSTCGMHPEEEIDETLESIFETVPPDLMNQE